MAKTLALPTYFSIFTRRLQRAKTQLNTFSKNIPQKKGNATQCGTAFMIFLFFPYTVFVKCVNTIKHNFPKAFALKNQFNATLHYRQFFDFYSAVATCQNAIKHIFKKHLHKKKAMQRNVALPENYILSKLLGTL